jgi:hypothetical protein
MEGDAGNQVEHVRGRVTRFLSFLTSEECRAACKDQLAADRLAFELCRLWIDEIYVPGLHYVDGIKGDRSTAAAATFAAAFTPAEQSALERFHHFLELRIQMLPEADRARGIFPDGAPWESTLRHARYLLDELERR